MRSICIVHDLHVPANKIKTFSVATEVQQLVPFFTVIELQNISNCCHPHKRTEVLV